MATTVARTNGSKKSAVQEVVERAATGATQSTTPVIEIARIPEETVRVPIVGTSPLIVHRFSEKAKRQMLDAMQGKKSPKTAKDPEAEFQAAAYRLEGDRYGLPSAAFKQATVGAARFYGKDVTMTALKQFIFVRGEFGSDGRALVVIEGDAPHMREDPVKLGRSGSDLRYRPEFWPWHASLDVSFFPSVITRDSVLSLIDAGGLAVGVGEWRPEKDGEFGTYRIDPDRVVEVIS
jgi:hypothetical protein